MAEITLPSDLGDELGEALHWYRGEPEVAVFIEHVRAAHAWSDRRPRRLLAWAERHSIPVFGHRRFLVVLNSGFECPERWRLWRAAKTELRRARDAIKAGEESALAYAGRDLVTIGASPRRWGGFSNDDFGPVAGVGLPPAESKLPPAEPGASPPSPPSAPSRPQAPRPPLGWLTR
jgi:hypothetical protein